MVPTGMDFGTERTFNEVVIDHSEIGRTELVRNQEDRENVEKSRVSY